MQRPRRVSSQQSFDYFCFVDAIFQKDAVMQAQRASIEHHINKIAARGESITQNVENIKRMIHERCELAMLEAERHGQEKV